MSELSDSVSKDELRAAALARRLALSDEARAAAAVVIAARPLPFAVPEGAIVAGYVPIRGEIDPLPLMRALAEGGARLALPVVTGPGRPLKFRAWSEGEALQRSRLGILEPLPGAPELVPDIVLAPLAAFDAQGHRIGYGAGHYDCTLAALRGSKPVIAAGLAFAVQQIEAVPAAAHDVALDYVITERDTLIFRSR
ncbi:5-formyltetrahydrofolate cyclo-ligase [Rhodopseudomonas palustris HaA2]|uniref:5-formyltetrahydrofolate cyclo-ligase n=1 Tax=Rhodopseudomonas palustris (strain HaA2) TaxID=316058 RepID=Q2IS34_RHOP2|nr:5-formyltetrahydrofolate cyclo-ligase [Rhodopseudomonas palustris]ABD08976.1 5-formyltetrahydrofolate cyclo-ligase [Rhodopseudomonas palustris HaA2]